MRKLRSVILTLILCGVLIGTLSVAQAQDDEKLVAEWHFDEGEGNILKDSSGNGNDGMIYGATWVDGKYGKALSFDGVDDYVEVPDSPSLDITDAITIEAWFRAIDVSGNSFILSHGESFDTDKFQYSLYIESGILKSWFEENGDNDCKVKGSATLATNKWYQGAIVQTLDGNIILYLNGKIEGSTSTNKKPPSISHILTMGLRTNSPNVYQDNFNGIIDEVRIYNRALTAEEIESRYKQGPTALSLTKICIPQSIKQGQTTTVTLTVKNSGSTDIREIEIADTIPASLIIIDGETSKSYDSLSPKDSRQFQYVVQMDEAGIFNLEPVTASYADDEGNYKTVQSEPASVEVIPSLISDSSQKSSTNSNANIQSASVNLHGEKTDVALGEDVLLKLSAVNIIGNPVMHVQVIIIPPSGWSVTSSEFAKSGAGQYVNTYDLESDEGVRDIEIRISPNQIGDDFKVEGRIVYYFGDDVSTRESHTLNLPITVRDNPEYLPTSNTNDYVENDAQENNGNKSPGFGLFVSAFGLFGACLVNSRKR